MLRRSFSTPFTQAMLEVFRIYACQEAWADDASESL